MSIQHCTLGYHQLGSEGLELKATQVGSSIYGNPIPFVNPIVPEATYYSGLQDYNMARVEYAALGITKKTAYTNARKKMIDTMDLLADYVDGIANGDESIIVLSGFTPSAAVAQSNLPLEKISNFTVRRTANDGELMVEIPAITNHGSINYLCVCSQGVPLSGLAIVDGRLNLEQVNHPVSIDFNKSRKKLFKSLTAGVNYSFYVFASNTVSVSPISDVKTVMAT